MASYTLRVHGDRTVDDVWERYADPQRWPEWSPQIKSVTATAERLAVGVSGSVQPVVGLPVPFDVTAYDEAARSWSWRVGWSVFTADLEHEVSRHDQGSETTLTLRGRSLLLLPYLPLARLALRRLVEA